LILWKILSKMEYHVQKKIRKKDKRKEEERR
jgi:hypothetical protein